MIDLESQNLASKRANQAASASELEGERKVAQGLPESSAIKVAVCVATYRRPEMLTKLLRSLTDLETTGLAVSVLVVDNDAQKSARPVCELFKNTLPGFVYAAEPERGIAVTRNRLVSLAAAMNVEYVAFVDDDEWVEPDWLAALIETAKATTADVVGGRVSPEYDEGVPEWIVRGGFFERPRFQSGTSVKLRSTSNLLLRRAMLTGVQGPFDRRFDLSGGSDAHLLEQLSQLGARMIWCDEAMVHEQVPRTRANTRWLLQRAFRSGLTTSKSAMAFDLRLFGRVSRASQAVFGIGKGMVRCLLALPGGRASVIRAMRIFTYEIGRLLGLFAISYEEYRRSHGR